ncbi:coenzyme F420-0:L-glutamate ligase/coenzyme F420-1:gamma-L-glutamate ligase [Phycicoccus badiiscoriae]|uniref:Coenzyme F420-0:L-glutamate ligase/coenzyme F420-1:gamma-L-glutamate ligase n=1 Tax=Pedococcus badiiscoriae TaxID=642776 RepID=A0A852WJ70_9MICO|nr:coenzyme F420-0:L-glutamate ligase/coenzyme F420-1:gamma-L-glutamate ligase [Pedococcus badiiscoriae]
MSVSLIPLTGIPEVGAGDDLVALLLGAADAADIALEDGDVVVVSSKVVSKSLGLWADSADRGAAVMSQTVRVVAERMSQGRITRIVQSTAGPVMAAAGVDASNTGHRDDVLLLPANPDAEAEHLRVALLAATGLQRLGVVLSDTAGRPWRSGQTDFALGASGVLVVDDLRGAVDADGRPLSVTARAVGDELAAAADLVKGKADAIPAALVRGTGWALPHGGAGARVLLRTGREDWFDHGSSEAVRAALGVEPGSLEAEEVGIPDVGPTPRADRLRRAVAVALRGTPQVGMDVGGDEVHLSGQSAYQLGVAVTRLQVALWGEGLTTEAPDEVDGVEVRLEVRER